MLVRGHSLGIQWQRFPVLEPEASQLALEPIRELQPTQALGRMPATAECTGGLGD